MAEYKDCDMFRNIDTEVVETYENWVTGYKFDLDVDLNYVNRDTNALAIKHVNNLIRVGKLVKVD